MKIHLVRHGETDWNNQGRIQGWIDVGLNETGIDQARRLSNRLPDCRFDAFSSPLRRARETLQILTGEVSTRSSRTLTGLKELNQGHWNGLRGDWLLEADGERYEHWLDTPEEASPPAGESLTDVRERVRKALETIGNNATGPILIVAHKVVNSLIVHLLNDRPLRQVLDSLPKNAQVMDLTVSSEEFPR